MRHALERRSRANRGLLPRFFATFGLVVLLSVLGTTAAFGHAERIGSDPEENASLRQPPKQLRIEFTEPPTGDANLVVMDGCQNDVVDSIKVENMEVSATLAEGQPGKWKVASTVVSGVDGHQTKEAWTFTVEGEKDCSGGDRTPQATGDEDDDDESSLPIVPIAIGTIVLVAAAVGVRALASRSTS